MVKYLETRTSFFLWLLEHPSCLKKSKSELIKMVGTLLVIHIAQITCNGSVINHWKAVKDKWLNLESWIDVACGVYPSVSMMNHSCKPNVSL